MTQIHTFRRPEWTTDPDGQPYPSPKAQQQLLERFEGDIPGLWEFMVECLNAALVDMPHIEDGVLIDRFLGWLPARQ